MLIVDRVPSPGSNQALGLPKETEGFLADDFQVGTAKEDWVIDHIRLWAVPDPMATSPRGLGDLFKKISLYGGIAPELPVAGQEGAPVCDCHNLPPIETAALEPDSNSTDNRDVKVSSIQLQSGLEVWQIDFENLKWSVPGGESIQFGVLAEPYPAYAWHDLASPSPAGRHLRVFSSAGKLQAEFHGNSAARMNIQVWGHLLARISIRPAGQKLRVVLLRQSYLEASQVDTGSLRFGPGNESPDSVRAEDVDQNGKSELVAYFRIADSGVAAKSINACLTGKRLDGAPFEGCDLMPH